MIDRTELDLRLDAHAWLATSTNGHGWKQEPAFPAPAPRLALAALLLRLAAWLDPGQGRAPGAAGLLAEGTGA
jgi:hypothetical protein